MSGFENYSKETEQLEHEIERKGVILGIDWNNAAQVRDLARQALDCKFGQGSCKPDDRLHRSYLEFFGLAQLMLTVMKESANADMQAHGGTVWKTFAHALWAEHDLRQNGAKP